MLGMQQSCFRKALQNLGQGFLWNAVGVRDVFGAARAVVGVFGQMLHGHQPVVGFFGQLQHSLRSATKIVG